LVRGRRYRPAHRAGPGLDALGTVLVAKGKGADLVAVLNVYANSPYGMYWLKSSGIEGIDDFAGKRIGNPPADAARAMWPALAKANEIDPESVRWVNVQANAKLAALKAGSIDVTTSFYNIHHIFQAQLGDDMGYFAWKDYGINPYGNSIVVNGEFLQAHPELVQSFVEVTQKAFAFCVENPEPCVDALVAANTGLRKENELQNWALVTELMSDEHSRTVGLGHFDAERMKADYDLVATYFELDEPFDIESAYTNEFVDTSIKMPK
jgi:NitT/TauT family transport system substrate-binding protein